VIGIDDEPSQAVHGRISTRPGIAAVPVAFDRPIAGGVSFRAGRLIDADGYAVDFSDVPTLPGDHNAQNAACAWAACRWLDVPREKIVAGLRSYPGLPHRQERVASVGNVVYINDSKATNADATAKALACYEPIYWILGGRPKETGLDGLEPYFPRIARAYLIGEAAADFECRLQAHGVATRQCGTLDRAVAAAIGDAAAEHRPEAVVLLSPAAASFDQFSGFEERGDRFRSLVESQGQTSRRAE
ncbi:MAG TPA: cyanophycin synthetase, partial [Verrucomicrobiae bacterium]|nr:cyanophycin synthetase [Verrucomicrobiae bacterium]